jgi:DNA-binding NarL/FixJ family response regulator
VPCRATARSLRALGDFEVDRNATTTVLIADDQPLMRSALRMSLDAEPDIQVVGEAADGVQAVEMAERLRPDVVIMDIRMPRLDGISAMRRLTAQPAPARVLAITTFDSDEHLVESLRAGASGFLLKDATPDELVHAVRILATGGALLAPAATRRLLDGYARRLPRVASPELDRTASLTERELVVLGLVAQGHANARIAKLLHVAESSVKTHIGHLLAKLGLPDRVHLVIFAYETGLVGAHSPDDPGQDDRIEPESGRWPEPAG